MTWITVENYEVIRGRECTIYLEPRAGWCDRGNYLAKLFPDGGSKLARDIDDADGWPRYYFDKGRAKLEVEAWLKTRGQWVELSAEETEKRFREEDAKSFATFESQLEAVALVKQLMELGFVEKVDDEDPKS